MPELYGQPFKDQLRAEIRRLNGFIREADSRRRELERQNDGLRYLLQDERERREELEQKLRELERKLSELAASLGEFRADEQKPTSTQVQVPRLVA
jgi:phage shock protein A